MRNRRHWHSTLRHLAPVLAQRQRFFCRYNGSGNGRAATQVAIVGTKDAQTVVAGGGRAAPPKIEGVRVHELGNVMTRSGYMTEVFRTDWSAIGITVRQVNWVQLNPGAVT